MQATCTIISEDSLQSGFVPDRLFDSHQPVSLYVHVPFCTAKCDYCAFYSIPASIWKNNIEFQNRYVDRIVEEITRCSKALGHPYETVFLGGGNPGCLNPFELKRILEAACLQGRPKECTVEMNPESLSEAHYPLFERYIDRLSMGVQSLDERTLGVLGRNVTLDHVLEGIDKAVFVHRRFGTRLSFDLMTCIPGQTVETALSDINRIYSLARPEHISLYCLTLEENTPLYPRLRPMSEQYQIQMLESCWNRLASLGYEHYEVSNFAKIPRGTLDEDEQTRSIHNCRYWDLSQYIGLGPAAAGTSFSSDGLVRWECPNDLAAYCSHSPFCGYSYEILSKGEELEEFLLVALRVKDGIQKQAFHDRFGFPFDSLLTEHFCSLYEDGMYIDTPYSFALTEAGWLLLDDIVLQLSCEADRM